MIEMPRIYCFDTNVLIQAWRTYYSPNFCGEYWNVLNELGKRQCIFLPRAVFDEIVGMDDDLANWLKASDIPKLPRDEAVINCWKAILARDPLHKHLVDNIKQRSLADPWVIAHAMKENACVVTKEIKETAVSTKRIKIPNVCETMMVPWINDFQFIEELNIQFSCSIS